jgi:hypothetical protein
MSRGDKVASGLIVVLIILVVQAVRLSRGMTSRPPEEGLVSRNIDIIRRYSEGIKTDLSIEQQRNRLLQELSEDAKAKLNFKSVTGNRVLDKADNEYFIDCPSTSLLRVIVKHHDGKKAKRVEVIRPDRE